MLAYCDYIASRIQSRIKGDILLDDPYVSKVEHVKMDLHPTEGYLLSTKKTIEIIDKNGKKYRVTVEEIDG